MAAPTPRERAQALDPYLVVSTGSQRHVQSVIEQLRDDVLALTDTGTLAAQRDALLRAAHVGLGLAMVFGKETGDTSAADSIRAAIVGFADPLHAAARTVGAASVPVVKREAFDVAAWQIAMQNCGELYHETERGEVLRMDKAQLAATVRAVLASPPASVSAPVQGEQDIIVDSYAFPCADPFGDEIKVQRARQTKGPALWKVLDGRGNCLNKRGEWEWEPMPSSRDDDFLARCRFETAEAAIRAARSTGGQRNG